LLMDDLAHVWYAFGQKSVGGKMAYTLPLNWRSSFKMPSHKCSVSLKRRNPENYKCLHKII
jgi:hypothetical protein